MGRGRGEGELMVMTLLLCCKWEYFQIVWSEVDICAEEMM